MGAKLRIDKLVKGNVVFHEHGTEDISGLDASIAKFENVLTETQDPTGWINNADITVSYDRTARTITLTGDLRYMWKGTEYDLGASWTSVAHDTGAGRFFLYSTDGTTFAWSTDVWKFYHLMVAVVRVSTTPAYDFALREVHGLMPWQVHKELHEQISSYRDSGGSLIAGTYTENTATDVATTPSFDQAIVLDEDDPSTLPQWNQGTYTTLRIGASSKATFDTTASFPFRYAVGGYIYYNDITTGNEIEAATNRYLNVYQILIPVTADTESQKYRMVMLQPQRQFTSLATALAEDPRALSLGDLTPSIPEFVLYARITYVTSAGDLNTGKVRIATGGVTYLEGSRLGQVSISGFTPANHNDLTGLQGGTSDEYYHLTSTEYTGEGTGVFVRKSYVDGLIGSANALVYKGTIDCSTNPNYPAADAGHLYVVSVAGKIGGVSGVEVEVGDMIICNTDGTVSGDQATVGTYWNIIQKNIVGAVTGPASSTDNAIARFDGATGKVVQDSGATIADDGAMTVSASTTAQALLTKGGAAAIQVWQSANGITRASMGLSGALTVGSLSSGTITTNGAISQAYIGTNVALGQGAGDALSSGGNYNTLIGIYAGVIIQTGNNNIMLGYGTDANGDVAPTNRIGIGYGTQVASDNTTVIGNDDTVTTNLKGNANIDSGKTYNINGVPHTHTFTIDDNSVTEPKLAMNDSPANGEVIAYNTSGAGYMEWVPLPAGYTDEQAQDAVGTILTDTATIDFTYTDATPEIKADVKDGSITYAKIQDVSATDKILGRATAGSGDVEEITCTAAGRALLDDASASAQKATLGVNDMNMGSATTVTIASGVATITGAGYYAIDTEGAAATDQLGSISGGAIGDLIVIRSANNARDTTVAHSTSIRLNGGTNFVLSTVYKTMMLLKNTSTTWLEISRSDNA